MLLFIGLIIVFSSSVSNVSAASTSTVYVNPSGDDNWDGLSATYNSTTKSGPKATVKYGIGTVADGGTVKIAPGNYSKDATGYVDIKKNLEITGQSRDNTILTYQFINIASGFSVILNNLTIKGASGSDGGAIINSGNLTVNNVKFEGNRVSGSGGAIINYGNLTINNSIFSSNTAADKSGGAIANRNNGNLTVNNTSFLNNIGSAVLNEGNSTFTTCNFLANQGTGGAAYNTGTLKIHYSRIVDNGFYGPIFLNDIYNFPEATIDASSNWWGINDDPSYGLQYVTINSWIMARISASASLIPKNGHTTVKLDFTHDNFGNLVAGNLPNGLLTTFKTNFGNIISNVYTVNGVAITTFTAGTSSGTASIIGSMDKQYLGTTINVDATVPTATANIKTGIYNTTKLVTITKSKTGTIYYTLNGSTPTTSSYKYSGTITISSSKVLKFFAVDKAGNKSPIYTYTYTIDKTTPKISSTTPTNLKTGIKRTSNIMIKFSENIKSSTYYNKITIKNSSGKLLTLTKSMSGNILTIKTSSKSANTWYTVTIPKGAIKDTAGNNLTANYSFKFRTGT